MLGIWSFPFGALPIFRGELLWNFRGVVENVPFNDFRDSKWLGVPRHLAFFPKIHKCWGQVIGASWCRFEFRGAVMDSSWIHVVGMGVSELKGWEALSKWNPWGSDWCYMLANPGHLKRTASLQSENGMVGKRRSGGSFWGKRPIFQVLCLFHGS